jgi:hypothetical protein
VHEYDWTYSGGLSRRFRLYNQKLVTSVPAHDPLNSHAGSAGKLSWGMILFISIPIAVLLQLTALVVAALLRSAPGRIVCTASVEGQRAIPCDFNQLVSESFGMVMLYNLILFGLPTLISYLLSVVVLAFSSHAYSSYRRGAAK